MLQNLKNRISLNRSNAGSWKTSRKILVIETDDWGTIRMPNSEIGNRIKKSSLGPKLSLFSSLDCLEKGEDLQKLLDVVSDFKDARGNNLILTLNTVMQNPDFKKIKESGFNEFAGKSFFDSYIHYWGEDLRSLWKKGMEEKLIHPQFHAREHLYYPLWLKDLKQGNPETRLAFDLDFFGLETKTSSSKRKNYLHTYFPESEEEFNVLKEDTSDGLRMFKETFGYPSLTFIATNFTWPKELETVLSKEGVKGIQCQLGNTQIDFKNSSKKIVRYFTGQKNMENQMYAVRNVRFEPYESDQTDWVKKCLKEIENAFFWKAPAILTTHRINFVSGMDEAHRDRNLKLFQTLLSEVLKKYPEIEFMSSDSLIRLIENENSHS